MRKSKYRKVQEKTTRGLKSFLGELELAIMDVVWERAPVRVRDVRTSLNEKGHQLAYTTVMTVLSRLKEKGWLTAEKRGRAYLYRASRSRQEAEAEAIGSVMRALLQDFGELAIAQFVREVDDINPEQLNRLAKLARQAGKEQDE